MYSFKWGGKYLTKKLSQLGEFSIFLAFVGISSQLSEDLHQL